MLIILIEIIVLFMFVNKFKRKGMTIDKIIIFALIIQSIMLIVYRMELTSIGRDVYYSDAEVYWNNTLALLKGETLQDTQLGYVYYSYIIQITSLFYWVGWNNISNILLIDLSIVLTAKLMIDSGVNLFNVKKFISILIFNPLLIYSLFRNLKDALFIFLLIVIIYSFINFIKNKHPLYLLYLCVLSIYITMIRPWGFIIIILLTVGEFFYRSLIQGRISIKIMMTCGIALIISIVLFKQSNLWNHIELWLPIVFESASKLSIIALLSGPIRILTGPGFYRAILGDQYFMFYTVSGNMFIAIGALLWWSALGYFCGNIKKNISISRLGVYATLIWLFFVGLYTMQYGGSLESRFRGVVYILTTMMMITLFGRKGRMKINYVVVFLTIFISIFATLFSI